MLRIGICDDVYDARLVLRAALERAAEKRRITAAFFEFSAGENLLRWLEGHAGELDLVFLDLEMGEVDGIETARRLRAADEGGAGGQSDRGRGRGDRRWWARGQERPRRR